MYISGASMNALYRRACEAIRLHGSVVSARGLRTLELTGVHLELMNPRLRFTGSKVRAMSMRYAVGELCFYLSGSTDLDFIAHYGKFWRQVSDDDRTVNSAYGNRLFPHQLTYVVECLKSDEASRKAVMPVYTPRDSRESRDNPCTMFVQLMIRESRLDCYVSMRSNDVWLGLPYDLAFFTLLQEIVLVSLRDTYPALSMGTYSHSATSLHCYEEHWPALEGIADERGLDSVVMPIVSRLDVVTWFRELLDYERSSRTESTKEPPTMSGVQGWLARWLWK